MKILIQVGDFEEYLTFDRFVDTDKMKDYLVREWSDRLMDEFMENSYDPEEYGEIPYDSETGHYDESKFLWGGEEVAERMADEFNGNLCDVGDVAECCFMTATVMAVRDDMDVWHNVRGLRGY